MFERVKFNEAQSGGGSPPSHDAPPSGAPPRTRNGDPVFAAGERLGGYEITRVLGIGGMAVVYAAVQLSLKRPVAVKVPLPRWASNESFMRRFERESEALAALDHPNIVNVIDRGQCNDLPFFVMEYVDGVSLERAIAASRLSYADFLTIIRQVRDALAYIHSNGIVHLDLKPANILLGRNGRVKVSDFGIAAMAWDSIVDGAAPSNSMLGTPRFMAPEQHQRAAILDSRTDIYALAVTYHLMFCGTFPEPGQLQPVLTESGMPNAVETVLAKALAHAPSLRYATVERFSNDLLEALVGTSDFLQLESLASATSFGLTGAGEIPTTAVPAVFRTSEAPELELAGSEETGTGTVDLADEERIDAPLAAATLPADLMARSGRSMALWTIAFPAAIALTAAAGAFWWPEISKSSRRGQAPPSLSAASVAPTSPAALRPWLLSGTLPVPRHSYSFLALSPGGDLALATFNNRSIGSLPEDLPVLLVRNALGGLPEVREICQHSFASQRGYSGLAFGDDGALFVAADTGLASTSFLARYDLSGELDSGFGAGGRLMPGLRCHGVDVANGKLYLSLETGEILVLDPGTGRRLGLLPKASGKGIVRDLAVDGASGRVFGVRSGALVSWSPAAGGADDFSRYGFHELTAPDSRPPRALEGIGISRAAGLAILVPEKTGETLECNGLSDPARFPIENSPAGAVFVDCAVSPNGETLFLSNVARMQVHLLRRHPGTPGS